MQILFSYLQFYFCLFIVSHLRIYTVWKTSYVVSGSQHLRWRESYNNATKMGSLDILLLYSRSYRLANIIGLLKIVEVD
jgi:hypothetical protein